MLAALVAVAALAGMYEEPPGGCGMPHEQTAPHRPPPPAQPARPEAAPLEDDAMLAESEMRAYEMESLGPTPAAQLGSARPLLHAPHAHPRLAGTGGDEEEDWEAIERAHLRELFVRDLLRQTAAVLTSAFVAWLIYGRLKAALRGGAEKADGEAAEKKAAEAASKVQAVQRGRSGRKVTEAQRAAKEAVAKETKKGGSYCAVS